MSYPGILIFFSKMIFFVPLLLSIIHINFIESSNNFIYTSNSTSPRTPKSLRDLHASWDIYKDQPTILNSSSNTSLATMDFSTNSCASSGADENELGRYFMNYQIIPEQIKEFLSIYPFPKLFEKYAPFDATKLQTWIKYFLSTSIPLMEAFKLIENLLKVEDETDSLNWWWWFKFNENLNDEIKVLNVFFAGALSIYFKGPIRETALQFLSDYKFVHCCKKIMIRNKSVI